MMASTSFFIVARWGQSRYASKWASLQIHSECYKDRSGTDRRKDDKMARMELQQLLAKSDVYVYASTALRRQSELGLTSKGQATAKCLGKQI